MHADLNFKIVRIIYTLVSVVVLLSNTNIVWWFKVIKSLFFQHFGFSQLWTFTSK